MLVLLSIIVAFLWALYPFIFKYYCAHVDPIVIWTVFSCITAVVSVIVAMVLKKDLWIGMKSYVPIMGAALIGPVLAMLLFTYLIKQSPKVTPVVALAFTSPLFALLLGSLLFGEKISIKQAIGICAIVCGIILVVMV